MKNLGQNIKRLRKERGLSQAKLAEKAECHLSNIGRIETVVKQSIDQRGCHYGSQLQSGDFRN